MIDRSGGPQTPMSRGKCIVVFETKMRRNKQNDPKFEVLPLVSWVALSLLVSGSAIFSFVHPAWLVRTFPHPYPITLITFGTFSFCIRVGEETGVSACATYSQPTATRGTWTLGALAYVTGCALSTAAAIASCLPLLAARGRSNGVIVAIGHAQKLAAALLMLGAGCLPMGFGWPLVAEVCGEGATVYDPGACGVGWGFMMAAVTSLAAIFCPLLGHVVGRSINDPRVAEGVGHHHRCQQV